MTRSLFLSLPFVLVACASTPLPPTVPQEHRIELQPLPTDPSTEPLPANVPQDDWAVSQEQGECVDGAGRINPLAPHPCPAQAGVTLSEARAARAALYQIRYRELRSLAQSDRLVFQAHRELYETRLRLADDRIQELKPSWFQLNGPYLAFGGGLLLGAILTVGTFAIVGPVLSTVSP